MVILSSLEDRDKEERLERLLDTDSLYLLILLLQIGLRLGTDFLAFCLNIKYLFFPFSSPFSNCSFFFYLQSITIHLLWYLALLSSERENMWTELLGHKLERTCRNLEQSKTFALLWIPFTDWQRQIFLTFLEHYLALKNYNWIT